MLYDWPACKGFATGITSQPSGETTTAQGDMNFPVTQAILTVIETALALP
jgi:hypothetical protein